jgi:single-stranded-DNA-specific exonuclease
MSVPPDIGTLFMAFMDALPGLQTHIHILTDSDADGLTAAALLLKALTLAGYPNVSAETRLKFESAWSPSVLKRLALTSPGAILITDLGSRADPLLPDVPTLLLDHHRPMGTPPGTTLISSYRETGPGENAN